MKLYHFYPEDIKTELDLLAMFAAHAPEPSKADIEFEQTVDINANPHNDTYKPPRRGTNEIIAYLKFKYAKKMLEQLHKEAGKMQLEMDKFRLYGNS